MIIEALFKNKPVARATVNTPQKPLQPLAPTPPSPSLSNILATQAVASVAGWHERKNAHAEKQARREKAEQKLLPFEKQNLPRLEPFTEPEPCLVLGDVSLPWIDKKFVLELDNTHMWDYIDYHPSVSDENVYHAKDHLLSPLCRRISDPNDFIQYAIGNI